MKICLICNEALEAINSSHLRKHNISMREYCVKYGVLLSDLGGRCGQKDSLETRMKRNEKTSLGVKKYYEYPENRKKCSEAIKKCWTIPEFREKTTASRRRIAKDPNFICKVHSRREMSEPELIFQEIIDINNLPYYFNGNFKGKHALVIDGKIPDFVHDTENKLIEIWGDYYHKGQNPQDRIDFFKKYGYDCLVIWASKMRDNLNAVIKMVEVFSKIEK